MSTDEMTTVLANWLREARAPGAIAGGLDEASFVAQRFTEWLRNRAEDGLGSAERFAEEIQAELERLGGWKNQDLVEAMEDATHLRESLGDLRRDLGLQDPASES